MNSEDLQEPPSSSTANAPEPVTSLPSLAPDADGMSRRRLLRGAAVGATALGALGGLALPVPALAASLRGETSALTSTASPLHLAPHAPASLEFPRTGQLREYWFQVDPFFHNVMPTGVDAMTGTTFTPNQTSFWALGYRAFTPGWGKLLPGNDDIGPNTGIPGPIIRAQVGDIVRVHYRNNDTYYKKPNSLSVHALQYTEANDGGWSWALRDRPGTAINVGETYTYEWRAIPRSVGTWPYHEHSIPFDPGRGTMVMEAGAELGLFGMLVVTDQNTPAADREFPVIWHTFYAADIPGLSQDFHCFNGFAYLGNTPNFRAKVGDRVRWRVVALGSDFHTFHIHAHTWLFNGNYEDTIVIGPGSKLTIEYVEDAPGTWYYHCHVPIHVMGPGMGGMLGFYIVDK